MKTVEQLKAKMEEAEKAFDEVETEVEQSSVLTDALRQKFIRRSKAMAKAQDAYYAVVGSDKHNKKA